MRMDFRDYYATLGVAKTASEKEIKQAYRRLARKHHPDVNPGDRSAETRFKELNEAYEVLGTPETRKKYDELGANWRQYEQAGPGAGRRPVGDRRVAGRAWRLPHHDARGNGVDVRGRRLAVLGLLQHVLRRPGRRQGRPLAPGRRPSRSAAAAGAGGRA